MGNSEHTPTVYLAYGSNANIEQMRVRCPSARPLGKATLHGYGLQFCFYADVYEDPTKSVECAVWTLKEKDEDALDMYEGYPDYYTKKYAEVEVPGLGRVKAMFYQMTHGEERGLCSPNPQYADGIRKGYEKFGIPLSQMTEAPGYKSSPDVSDDEEDDLFEQTLNEIDMTPSNLRQKAESINALGGMEFEMLVPPNGRTRNGGLELRLAVMAQHFSAAIGRPVNYSDRYHGARRAPGHYCLEPDSSLRTDRSRPNYVGFEFVTPPLPIPDLFRDLKKVKQWAKTNRCYTNDSCGLHMSVSVPVPEGKTLKQKLNYVKLVLLMGDEQVLREYGRELNGMCKSAMQQIRNRARTNPALCQSILRELRADFYKKAGRLLHDGNTTKYESVNVKRDYVEFRSPGGDYLNKPTEQLENTMLRFVVALDAACDTNKYRKLYREKLEALVSGNRSRSAGYEAPNKSIVGLISGDVSPEALANTITNGDDDLFENLFSSFGDEPEAPQENEMTDQIVMEGNSQVAYFFAYDQFVNEDVMRMNFPRAKRIGAVTLPNHALEFRSLPNIIQRTDGNVTGILWQVTSDDIAILDVKYEVRHGNYRRATAPMTIKKGRIFPRDVQVSANYYMMPQESIELRPQLAAPNSRTKNDIVQAFKADPRLPDQQLADAPGWTLMPRSQQEKSAQQLRVDQRRRSGVSPRGRDDEGKIGVSGGSGSEAVQESEQLDEIFGGKSYYYFGYGANSNSDNFKSRCRSAKYVGVGILKNFSLEFRSYANIVPKQGSSVQGVIWKISEQDLNVLDRYEGVADNSYSRRTIPCRVKGKALPLNVIIYEMTEDAKTLRDIAAPKETYLHTISVGYRARGIPEAQISGAIGINEPMNVAQQRPIRELRAARDGTQGEERRRRPERTPQEPDTPPVDTGDRPQPVTESRSMRDLIALVETK